MKRLLVTLFLFIFASSAIAAELGKRGKKEYMGACGEADAGIVYAITNGSDAASCDPDQAVGTERIYCSCAPDGVGGYAWTLLFTALGGEEVDLSAYALLAGDADGQTIQGWVGSDAARVDIGGTAELATKLIGGGATSGVLQADDNGAYGFSPDSQTSVEVTNSGVSLVSGSGMLTVASDGGIRLLSGVSVPTNATDPCTAGTIKLDSTFIYFCYATDTWVRVAMATWP